MSTKWQTTMLGAICNIELGRTPSRGDSSLWDTERRTGNVWLSIADLLNTENNFINDSKEYISEKGTLICKKVPAGTLLVSFKLTLGRLAFSGCDLYTNEAIAALYNKNDSKILNSFLFYYLHFFDWKKYAETDVKLKGVTLNKAKLTNLPIQFPSLSEQKRIVATLDKAFAAIAKAKRNTEKNVTNARAIFDSELNAIFTEKGKKWEKTKLGSVIDLLTGFAFKSQGYTSSEEGIPLLRGDNIIQGAFRWDNVKKWPKADAKHYEKFRLQENDVVLAMDRTWVNSGLKYSQISKDDLPCLLLQRVARLRAGREMEHSFLKFIIGSPIFKSYVLSIQTGLGVPHISGKQISDFEFHLPPRNKQKEIAESIKELDKYTRCLKSRNEQKILELGKLQKSFLHHAFTGHL